VGRSLHRPASRDPSGRDAGLTVRVYGRTEYAEPLVELGSARDEDDVRGAHGGDWLELVAFPEAAIHWIIRDGETVLDA
jgi:hypothetical protein